MGNGKLSYKHEKDLSRMRRGLQFHPPETTLGA
jgi:hypothetical protein